MKMRPLPPADVIRAALSYAPETGVFTWNYRPGMVCGWNKKWAGKTAGATNPKGISIFLNGIPYYAHRLAWVYVNGDGLDQGTQVDHRNCDCYDNRYENLRSASHGQNASNSRRRKTNKYPKGVAKQPHGTGFRATIGIDKKIITSAHSARRKMLTPLTSRLLSRRRASSPERSSPWRRH